MPYGRDPVFASRRLLATAVRKRPDQLDLSFTIPNTFSLGLSEAKRPVFPQSKQSTRAPQRGDDLWKSTCFEAFIRRPGGGYYELNLTADKRWAVYAFTGYRQGMRPAHGPELLDLAFQPRGDRIGRSYTLRASIAFSESDGLPRSEAWSVALSAVLEHSDGAISYWALAHPAGKPDFHHPDSFVLSLPAPA